MGRLSLLLLGVILQSAVSSTTLLAHTVSHAEASILAKNLPGRSLFLNNAVKGQGSYIIEKTDSIVYDGKTLGYFFNYEPDGFVLIPKFRELDPYFAFSDRGRIGYDTTNFISSFLKEELILRYRALNEGKLSKEAITQNSEEWDKYLNNKDVSQEILQYPPAGLTTTGGLIETTWGQGGVYNDFCPADPVTGKQSVTGCVATAMAQVVNYWGTKTGMPGSAEFTSADNYTSVYTPDSLGTRTIPIDAVSASFSGFTYPLSSENKGRLSFACGVSVKMRYSSVSSSAITLNIATALENKFGFSNAEVLYYDSNLDNVLRENIEARLPCILAIRNANDIGHAIICDGFIDDGSIIRFHLNYGWDGQFVGPSFFYEIPEDLPADFTTITYGIVNIISENGIFDIIGNHYDTVTIGSQVWMAENLKTTKYFDGTDIPYVTDGAAWGNLTTPGFCWYENDIVTYKDSYGALYNWYSVNTGKLCPYGWHVPSEEEWTVLVNHLGGESEADEKLKAITGWGPLSQGGTNESGFSALPGGYRSNPYNTWLYYQNGWYGYWWSVTGVNETTARLRYMGYDISDIPAASADKKSGYSVRCIQDKVPLPEHFIPMRWPDSDASNMDFYILEAVLDGADLQPGDEIGIYDNNLCVGAVMITEILAGTGFLKCTVPRDDPNTSVKDGFSQGALVKFRIWDVSRDIEITGVYANFISGTDYFAAGRNSSCRLTGIGYHSIITLSNPVTGGSTTGSGTYIYGSEATVRASVNAGYRFINWTEDNAEVSKESSFSFIVSGSRVLTANFEVATSVQPDSGEDIEIYPNPVKEILYLKAPDWVFIKVTVIDHSGKILIEAHNRSIDLSNLKPGLYFVVVNGKVFRIIKQL